MSQTVYGKPIEDAKAGPAEMQAASVDLADRICSLLRSSADAEIISTDTMYEGNELGVRSLLESMQNEAAWTARQSMDGLQISAKYKCAEFSPMLRVYEAAHGPTR
ncbi:hypothetical protein GV791_14995 [Nocardia cyriacigeorgica]|uniref:Uncharacterized protein n=1 Tax=Nocardia cyriacigeorgica TaxID=135487 RepID=A0A6P1CMR6_9NOCA|nr:hypothetical protein [Nocardia cyriacigeorgica]NEW33860.1 hypothetical protein [Nocardia cyriacigeorgica]